uniref:Translation initiation factor eIF2B subunit gamma n=1 Tax=Saccoglossus kowalevskii TaxID=10224 RepID=A0ABM0MDS0_SACKO|nr:PREDICTED: translation initiation factor eIF-2B subunit gamma-like [Saccoglossus kowalevskii]
MEFQAVILAAGRGSRMLDLTSSTPKALLPIGNKPLIWYPVNLLERAGFEDAILICLESACTDIKNALAYNTKLNLDIVSIPTDEDWGTADSLRYIKDKIKTDIIVLSCDLVTNVSLHHIADVHRTYDSTITMLLSNIPEESTDNITVPGVKSKRKQVQQDLVGLDKKGKHVLILASEADLEDTLTVRLKLLKKHPRIRIHNKLLDGHLYIMKKWVVDFLCEKKSISTIKGELLPYLVKKQFSKPKKVDEKLADMSVIPEPDEQPQDVFSFCKEDELTALTHDMSTWNDHTGDMADCYHNDIIRCYAYTMQSGHCLRVNTLPAYIEANRNISKQISSLLLDAEEPLIHSAAVVKNKSQIGHDCMIGEGSNLTEKVSVKKSIIGKHCKIGEKVRISSSIIMDHVTISDG